MRGMKRGLRRAAALAAGIMAAAMMAAPVSAADGNMLSAALSAGRWEYSAEGALYYEAGQPHTGWLDLDGKRYYFGQNSILQTGWQKIDGKSYYFNEKGEMQTGWLKLEGVRYYLGGDGVPVSGTMTLDGTEYVFAENGALLRQGAAGEPAAALSQALEGVVLSPKSTVNEELNTEIEELLALLNCKDRSVPEQIQAVYDFMTANYEEGEGALFVGMDTFLQIMDGPESDALQMLRTGAAGSEGYAAAFAAVVRKIGLDCKVVSGTLLTAEGETVPHSWAVVSLGGTEYLFDPQQEQQISGTGRNLYSRFGKTYAELNGIYQAGENAAFQ